MPAGRLLLRGAGAGRQAGTVDDVGVLPAARHARRVLAGCLERRAKLVGARGVSAQAKEDFSKMLEESSELTEGMRWSSKVARLFEQDERWQVHTCWPRLQEGLSSLLM